MTKPGASQGLDGGRLVHKWLVPTIHPILLYLSLSLSRHRFLHVIMHRVLYVALSTYPCVSQHLYLIHMYF